MIFKTKTCQNPQCCTKLKNNATFCPQCGLEVAQRQAKFSQNRWFARADEFAAAFTINDLEGFFKKAPLEVESGQQALIFQDGQFQGVLSPGSYSFESFFGQLNRLGRRKNVRGILLRSGEMNVTLGVSKLPTREFLTVEAELSLGIKIADPALFDASLMMGRQTYTLVDLRKLLLPQITQLFSEYTRSRSIRELAADTQLRQQLTLQIKQGLDSFLLTQGLALGQVQTIAVGHHRFDEHNQIRGSAWLDVDKLRMEQEIRQQLDELYNENEWRKIAELETMQQIETKLRDVEFRGEESEFVNRLRRIDLLDKIRNTDVREAGIEAEASDTLAQLEHDVRQKQLKRDDEAISWEHIRELASIKYTTERTIAEIEQKRIIDFARLQLEQDLENKRLQHQIEQAQSRESEQHRHELTGLKHQLEQQRIQSEARLAENKRKLIEHADEMIQREREAEFERVNKWKDKSQELELEEKRKARVREHLDFLSQLNEDRKDQKLKREQLLREEKRKDNEQQNAHRLGEIEALGKVNTATLIALSDADQGELIATLQRTKVMENMSSDQIMAMVAENSPHVAEALQERFRHTNDNALSEQERQFYAKLVEQSKSEADRTERNDKAV